MRLHEIPSVLFPFHVVPVSEMFPFHFMKSRLQKDARRSVAVSCLWYCRITVFGGARKCQADYLSFG
jgi:hypothetical protein